MNLPIDNNVRKLAGTLAIDLGSTTTVVAFQPENQETAQLLELASISRAPGEIPSLIWKSSISEQASFLFGQEVKNLTLEENKGQVLISDFKRWIGAPKSLIPRDFELSPEDAGELLIKEIWKKIPQELEVKKLVLTAPIEAYKEYRKWLHSVCSDLNVQEIALVDEPTAAAFGAGLPGGSKLLVVDVGGSTIDMSMVLVEGGEGEAEPIAQLIRFGGEDLEGKSKQVIRGAKVLGKAGIRLGGRDLDRWILNYLYPDSPQTELLLNAAEKLKCRLSDVKLNDNKKITEEVSIKSQAEPKQFSLSRLELEDLLNEKGLFKSISKLLEKTLSMGRSNGYEIEDLTGVVIVGGGSQIPSIKKFLIEKIGEAKLLVPPPIETVAIGALKLTPGVIVRDILHRGIALRYWDQKQKYHSWHPLFFSGQPWPTIKPLEIVISANTENQLEVELIIADNEMNQNQEIIYENGIPVVQDNDQGSFPKVSPWRSNPVMIKLDQPGQPGFDCLKLRFSINKSCQLHVEGFDLRSNNMVINKTIGSMR